MRGSAWAPRRCSRSRPTWATVLCLLAGTVFEQRRFTLASCWAGARGAGGDIPGGAVSFDAEVASHSERPPEITRDRPRLGAQLRRGGRESLRRGAARAKPLQGPRYRQGRSETPPPSETLPRHLRDTAEAPPRHCRDASSLNERLRLPQHAERATTEALLRRRPRASPEPCRSVLEPARSRARRTPS